MKTQYIRSDIGLREVRTKLRLGDLQGGCMGGLEGETLKEYSTIVVQGKPRFEGVEVQEYVCIYIYM